MNEKTDSQPQATSSTRVAGSSVEYEKKASQVCHFTFQCTFLLCFVLYVTLLFCKPFLNTDCFFYKSYASRSTSLAFGGQSLAGRVQEKATPAQQLPNGQAAS